MSESIFRRDPKTGKLDVIGLRYSIEEFRAQWMNMPDWVKGKITGRSDNAKERAGANVTEVNVDAEEHALKLAALWIRRGGGSLASTWYYERSLYLQGDVELARRLVECIERHGADEGGPLFAPPDGAYDLDVVELAKLLQEALNGLEGVEWRNWADRCHAALDRQFLGRGRS